MLSMNHLDKVSSIRSIKETPDIGSTSHFVDQETREETFRKPKTLLRVYSENETGNFHETTGHRLFDDDKYRPVLMHQDLSVQRQNMKRHNSVQEKSRPYINNDGNDNKSLNNTLQDSPADRDSSRVTISSRSSLTLSTDSIVEFSNGVGDTKYDGIKQNKSSDESIRERSVSVQNINDPFADRDDEEYDKYFVDSIENDNECVIPLEKLPRMKSTRSTEYTSSNSNKKRERRHSENMFDEYLPDFDIINNLNRLSEYYGLGKLPKENYDNDDDVNNSGMENMDESQQDHRTLLNKNNVFIHDQQNIATDDKSSSISMNKSSTSLKNILQYSQVQPIPVNNSDRARKRVDHYSESTDNNNKFSHTTAPNFLSIKTTQNPFRDFEIDLNKIPDNFDSLPYSQRKKTLLTLYPNQDFKTLLDEVRSPKNKIRRRGNTISSMNSSSLASTDSSLASSTNVQMLLQQFNTINGSSSDSTGSTTPNGTPLEHIKRTNTATSATSISRGLDIMGYKLDKIIGHGAWGVIRECHSLEDENDVKAMKIVRFKHHEEVKKSVLNEVNVWKQLDHPNILALVKYHHDDHAMFCLMNKIYGGTLYDVVAKNWHANPTLTVESKCEQVVQYALQLIEAIKYLHQQKNIVHGDLKLENCLITQSNDQILLCDFGMAQCKSSSEVHKDNDGSDDDDESSVATARFNKPAIAKAISSPSLNISCNTLTSQRIRSFNNLKNVHSISSKQAGMALKKSRKNFLLHGVEAQDTGNPTLVGITSFQSNFGPAIQSITLSRSPSKNSTQTQKKREKIALSSNSLKVAGPEESKTEDENSIQQCNQIGSLPYAAPELVQNANTLISYETDIWALGCMLYCMVLGQLPFQHEYEPRLRVLIESGKYNKDLLRETLDSVNKHLREVIEGCLIIDPAKRWDLEKIEKHLLKQ